jgi:hypothetical protein
MTYALGATGNALLPCPVPGSNLTRRQTIAPAPPATAFDERDAKRQE